jgi:hypothetical protein
MPVNSGMGFSNLRGIPMKMAGVNLETPVEELLVLPRGDQNIVFKARPIVNMDDFEKLCPEPRAPIRNMRGGIAVPNLDDPGFKREVEFYAEKRMAYIIIKSLDATEGLEWDKVNPNDSNTWMLYRKELEDANFSVMEISRIVALVLSANCLDEKKLEEARKSFLAGQLMEQARSTGRSTGTEITHSGKPVPASV